MAIIIHLSEGSELLAEAVDAIGIKAAIKLIAVFSGETVKFPTLFDVMGHVRTASAVMDILDGTPVLEAASDHHVEPTWLSGVAQAVSGKLAKQAVIRQKTASEEDRQTIWQMTHQ